MLWINAHSKMRSAGRAAGCPRRGTASAAAKAVEALEARRLLASVPPGFNTDVAYGGNFTNGTAMDFSPDGRLWATTQNGNVFVIQPGGAPATLAATITVNSFFERGLLGIAFDPSFDAAAPGADYVYFYYTELPAGQPPGYTGSTFNRVSRFEVTGNTINLASETLVMRFDQVSAGNHNGGAIHFGPDGKLYVAIGENAVTSNAQSLANRHGKMLRINPDGTIPDDNPTSFPGITGSPTGNNRAIWAVGLRNPYTFAFQPGTGRMHINDVGSGSNSWEEVNDGQAGRNFGWPQQEGHNPPPPGNPNFTYPVYTYPRAEGFTITGGAFYNVAAHTFPADYLGDYIFADLSTGWLRRLDAANGYQLQTTGGASGGNWLVGASAPVDVKIGPDGGLYFLQRGSGNGGQGVRVVRPTNPSPYVTGSQFQFNGTILPDAPHSLQFSFSENVGPSLGSDDLLLENLTAGTTVPTANIAVAYDSATNTASFTFPGYTDGVLPDGRYRATLLGSGVADSAGQSVAENRVVNFFFLNGDANRDGIVNLADFNILAANFGQSPRDFTQGDFTYDGIVNLADFNILASRFGQVVAPATTSSTVFGGASVGSTSTPFGTTRVTGESQRDDAVSELLA